MVVVGGSGYFFGPFLGAIVAVLLPEWMRFAEGYYLIGYAVLVIVLMVFCPSGLLGLAERLLIAEDKTRRRAAKPQEDAMSTVLEVRDLQEELRRHPCGRRRLVRRERGRDPRHHRAERQRQVDAVQLHPRPASPDLGRSAARRPRRHRHAALRSQPARRQPHVPAAAGVSRAHRAREPDPRRAGAQGLDAVAPVRRARRGPDPATPTA